VESQLASISVQAVVPGKIEDVAVEKIIAVRKQGASACEISGVHPRQSTEPQGGEKRSTMRTHCARTSRWKFKKEVQPELDGLKQRLHELQVDCSLGAFNVRVLPPDLWYRLPTWLAWHSIHFLAAGAGLALAIIPLIRDKRSKRARK